MSDNMVKYVEVPFQFKGRKARIKMSNGEQRKDKLFVSVKKRKSRGCVRLGQFLNHRLSAPNLCGAGHFRANCLTLSFSQCRALSGHWKVA